MAINDLSQKLKNFQSTYSTNINTAKRKKDDEINLSLTNLSDQLMSIKDTLTTAGDDSTINEIKACIDLSKDGLVRVRECIDEIINKLFNDCEDVNGLITTILDLKSTGDTKQGEYDSIVINSSDTDSEKQTKNERKTTLQGEINDINAQIDFYNNEGEKKLDSMQNAMSTLSFGVIGNMVKGGTLGAKSLYDTYTIGTYTPQNPNNPPPNPDPPATASTTRNSFEGANEFDVLDIPAHEGKSKVICIPRNMKELKDAIRNGQPFILEKGSKFQYDQGGLGFDFYDATDGRKYFVKCEDGFYREVFPDGTLVNGENVKIDPKRVYGAGDNSKNTSLGTSWTNDTGFEYKGEERETIPPVATGSEKIDMATIEAGDSYVGKKPTGEKIHQGPSDVVAVAKSMLELKEAVANGQPFILEKGTKFQYDQGGLGFDFYDATEGRKYFIKCEDGFYREVFPDGTLVNGENVKIDPERIYGADDNSKNTSLGTSWTNDTGLEYQGK